MEKFSSFTEEKGKPYKLVILTHSEAGIRDTKDNPEMTAVDAAEKLGLTVFSRFCRSIY